MPYPVRFVPPGGAVFELTSRTFQERFLLRPSDILNEIVVGVLGRAQRLYEVQIYAAAFLSNHFHLLVRVLGPEQLSGFMQYFKGNLAKEAGKLHGWRGGIWGRRYRPVWIAEETTALVSKLRYILAQACKEGLVASPIEWPGVHCAEALMGEGTLHGRWFDRTRENHERRLGRTVAPGQFAAPETVVFSPLPCWAHLSREEYRETIRQLVREIEEQTARDHEAAGTRPMGVDQILGRHPHERPLKPSRSPAPLFHAATRAARDSMRAAYSTFLEAYYRAKKDLRRGRGPVEFPPGCFPPRLPVLEVAYQLVPT